MKLLQELLEYETKSGQRISFKREEDIEEENRGWVVHKLTAYIPSYGAPFGEESVEERKHEVGYLKITYIPKERFKKHFPSILHYIDKIQGWGLGFRLPSTTTKHWTKLSKEKQAHILKQLISRLASWHASSKLMKKVEDMSKEEIQKRIRAYEKRLIEGPKGRQFREFYAHHVDRPYVDYIHVEPNYRRQRIATALYQEGAEWMREKGLRLHASGIQSPEAQAAWEFMGKELDVRERPYKKHQRRRYLNV